MYLKNMKSPFEFKIFSPKTAGLLMVGMDFPRKSIQALANFALCEFANFQHKK